MSSLLLIFYITVSLQQTFIFQAIKMDHVLRWFQLSIMISILCSLRVLSFLVQVWGSEWKTPNFVSKIFLIIIMQIAIVYWMN